MPRTVCTDLTGHCDTAVAGSTRRRTRHARADDDDQGFGLVELLVVMVVIGILAAIAVPQFVQAKRQAHRTAVKADLRTAMLAVDDHFEDNPSGYQQLTNPYFRSTSGVHWRDGSPGVTISVSNNPASTATTYCLRGSHDAEPGETWRFKRGVDRAPRRLACNA